MGLTEKTPHREKRAESLIWVPVPSIVNLDKLISLIGAGAIS
jgi:hypothetical protein